MKKQFTRLLAQLFDPPRNLQGRSGNSGEYSHDEIEILFNFSKKQHYTAAVSAAVETMSSIAKRPGMNATLNSIKSNIINGQGERYNTFESVSGYAETIKSILDAIEVKVSRIGMDGIPGSGKSTLARSLAEALGLKWRSLDHENLNIQMNFTASFTIYEHHRLLRTQNVDVFDVIIYIDETINTAKARIMQRTGRSALMIDFLDFDKLTTIGSLAFEVCGGESIVIPNSNIVMKIKPTTGFHAVENLLKRLNTFEYEVAGLNKEEMLFLLAYGIKKHGLSAYMIPEAYNEEIVQGVIVGLKRLFRK